MQENILEEKNRWVDFESRFRPTTQRLTGMSIPVYKNNNVFLNKSKSDYSSVAIYSKNPHIDGYVSKKNMEDNLKGAASLIVSDSGSGRVVLFADNPNFRGSWYGTNKLFLNAIFFGANISVPK